MPRALWPPRARACPRRAAGVRRRAGGAGRRAPRRDGEGSGAWRPRWRQRASLAAASRFGYPVGPTILFWMVIGAPLAWLRRPNSRRRVKPGIEFVPAAARSRSLATLDGCSFVEKLRKLHE